MQITYDKNYVRHELVSGRPFFLWSCSKYWNAQAMCTENVPEKWSLSKPPPATCEHLPSPLGPTAVRQVPANDDFLAAISGLRMIHAKPVNYSHMETWRDVPGPAETPISKLTRRLLEGLRMADYSAATPIAAVAFDGKLNVSDAPPTTAHQLIMPNLARTRKAAHSSHMRLPRHISMLLSNSLAAEAHELQTEYA